MSIRLQDALLCINCDTIFEFPDSPCNETCPTCTSNAYIRLASILNRSEEENNKPL